jgi:hypothetical protein
MSNAAAPALRTLALLAVALLAMLAPPAHAGTYRMNQCASASSRATSMDWSVWNNIRGGTFYNTCGIVGGSFGINDAEMEYASVAGLEVRVPESRPHVTIARVEANVTAGRERLDPSYCCNKQVSFFRLSAGGQVLFDQEMTGWTQAIGRDVAGSRDLQVGIYCTFANGPQNCGWETDPVIGVDLFTLSLDENAPPTAQPTGGSLLAGGTLSGTRSLSYTAIDQDSGVHDVSVQLGDTTVGTDHYGDRCPNDDWNACPNRQERSEMPIDTNQVPDGTSPLKFVVTDAAGNTATVDSGRTVTVSNPRANGPGAVAKTTAVQLRLGQGQGQPIRTTFGRKVVITGQALAPNGQPLGAIPIEVAMRTTQPGQDFAGAGQMQTDANGAFAFRVPPGPDRTLRFAYTSPISDGVQARGQSDVALQVRAGAHLTVSDRRIAGGRRVTFRGQLKGGPIPAGGVPIGFRGKVGKHTRKFADTQTDSQGRFRLVYRFPATGPSHTYPVWVRIGADAQDYPYLPGLSNHVRVTVLR